MEDTEKDGAAHCVVLGEEGEQKPEPKYTDSTFDVITGVFSILIDKPHPQTDPDEQQKGGGNEDRCFIIKKIAKFYGGVCEVIVKKKVKDDHGDDRHSSCTIQLP